MTKLFLLQSGFVTPSSDFLVKEEKKEMSLRDRLYMKDTRIADNNSYYDEKIEKLFQLYRQDNERLDHFEFREDILRSAIRVFSHEGFSLIPWARMQMLNRTAGYLHKKYLIETLQYINGYPRDMDNYTYFRILSPVVGGENFNTGSFDVDVTLEKITAGESDLSLTQHLVYWTSKPDGFSDLLKTLHVIYGRRVETMTTPSRVS